MRGKTIKIILMVSAAILAITLFSTSLRNCSLRRRDRERAERLEQRAREFEEKFAEAAELHSKALEALGRTELELEHLRDSYLRLKEITGELDAENQRLRVTVGELEDLYGELTAGIGDAQELTRALETEVRGNIAIVERLQSRSGETD